MNKLVTEYIWLLRRPEASIKFSHQSRYFFNSKHQSNSRAGLEINQCEQVLARKFSQADSPPPPETGDARKHAHALELAEGVNFRGRGVR